jgi:hypothetical protein
VSPWNKIPAVCELWYAPANSLHEQARMQLQNTHMHVGIVVVALVFELSSSL